MHFWAHPCLCCLVLGYIFLPYIRGPCSTYFSNGGTYKTYINETSQVRYIEIPYKIYRGETLTLSYFHKVNEENIEFINPTHVLASVAAACVGDRNCIDIVSTHILHKEVVWVVL